MVDHTRMWPTNLQSGALRLDMSMNSLGITSSQITRFAFVACIVVFVVLTYWISFSSLVDLWQQTDHAYGILVFPICAFLIWRLRREIRNAALVRP